MKILTSEQMRNIDRRAIDQFGIPSIVLMENAALAVVDAIGAHYPAAEKAAIFCGLGQNGGDGFAIARHLESRGVTPMVFIVGKRDKITDDARTNLVVCERLGLPIYDVTDSDSLDQALARATEADILVDALFGTGLNRPPEGLYAEAIRGIMSIRLPVVAVDVPSGLNASSRETTDPSITAELTITFAQPKVLHVFEPAALQCGEVVVADISIPHAAVEAEGVTLSLITPEEMKSLFPRRRAETHKGTYGHAAIVAGAAGHSGAAILAARGAIRSGCGLVTVVSDPRTADLIDAVSIESMTLHQELTLDSVAAVARFIASKSAALIGPGLLDEPEVHEAIRALTAAIEHPLVLDATAVNAFEHAADEINPERLPRILTPHPGELARLLGTTTARVNGDRVAAAREAAHRTQTVVLLKGHQTIIADWNGPVTVNPTGNPGMASGGMGDVLGGIIVSLLAQGFDPFEAACAGAYLHGLAADAVKEAKSDIGISAMDVAEAIPGAIEALRQYRPAGR